MNSGDYQQADAARQGAPGSLDEIANQVPGIVYQFRLRPDGSTCVPYASQATREIYRLDPKDVREDASMAFSRVHPDDVEDHLASIHVSARDLTPWQHEYRLKFDDGTVRWLSGNALPQREADGATLWHGFVTDITRRKLEENALREREERYRHLFEDVHNAIVLIKDGRFVDCNSAALKLMGYCDKDELIGLGPNEISPAHQPDGRLSGEKSAEMVAIALRSNYHQFEWMVGRADGSVFPAEVILTPVTLDGELIVHAFFRDISERKQAEASLRAEQEAKASRAAIRKLAAHREELREEERKLIAREVHDELGQVLSALRLEIALLKDRVGADNAVMNDVERSMLALVDRAIRGVRNVASSLRPVEMDMGNIAATEWQCAEFSRHSGIPCALEVTGDIAGLSGHQALALFRIVQESLTNIARHAAASRVEIGIAASNGAIEAEIRDNGRGFDPEKADGDKSFGLLGMRERAISVGGELDISSEPGQGTSIRLHIPVGSPRQKGSKG